METEATAADDGAARPIGAVLGAARRARGLELSDIARDTRVPVRHLSAIEADAHDSLPALPYAIGFVKAFARAVGVDPEMAALRFRAETSKAAHVPVAPAMTPLDERRLPPRGLITASIVALVVVVGGIVAWSAGAFDPAPPVAVASAPAVATPRPTVVAPAAAPAVGPGTTMAATPDAVPATTPGTVSPATTSVTPAAAPTPVGAVPVTTAPTRTIAALPGTATPATATGGVVITASEDAWFRVSVFDATTGKVATVKTGVLAKGERYVPPPTPGLRLWTGRAGALAITVDGRAIPPLGGPVETVKNVSLDPADLRARLALRTAPAPGRAGPPVG